MSPLRFQLRTLMIAVAIAGVECWLAVSIHWSIAILSLGPLVGIGKESGRSRARPFGYLRSALGGGFVMMVPFWPVLTGVAVYLDSSHFHSFTISLLGFSWGYFVLALCYNLIVGGLLGLLAEAASLLFSLVTLPWKPVVPISEDPPRLKPEDGPHSGAYESRNLQL